MTEAATFTVVIPCYQSAHLVGDAVASVVGQTRRPEAVVVVDDGSTDDVAAALAPFGSAVELVRIEHGGTGAALNRGVDAVHTTFVAFLDADDAYEPTFLEAVAARVAAEPELDVVTVDVVFEKAVAGPAATFYSRNEFPSTDQRSAILRSCFLTMMSAVRVERVRAVGGFDETFLLGNDWDFWIRVVLDGARVGVINEVLGHYRQHEGQVTAKRASSLAARVAVLEKALTTPGLSDGERAAARHTLAEARTRAAIAAAVDAPSRARWAEIARDRRLGRRARAFGLVGLVSPRCAAHRARLRW